MAFKMKGSPYKMGKMATKSALKQTQKPYSGTTDSPTRQFEPGDYYDTRSKSPNKQFEPGDYYDTKTDERKLPMDMKSPAKAHKKGHDDMISPTDPNSPTKMKSPVKNKLNDFDHQKETRHDKYGKHEVRYGDKKSPVKDTKYFGQNTTHSEAQSVTAHNKAHKKGLPADHKRKKEADKSKLPVVKNGGKVAKP